MNKRAIGGMRSKRNGQLFEAMFERRLHGERLTFDRFPDGCIQTGPKTIKRVRTPYDWVITHGRTALIDTKSFNKSRISPSDITDHQRESLVAQQRAGAIAGYIVHFAEAGDAVVFIPAEELERIFQTGVGMNWDDPRLLLLGRLGSFSIGRLFEKRSSTGLASSGGDDRQGDRDSGQAAAISSL